MTETLSGLVCDILEPSQLDDYVWGSLNDYANHHDAHVLLLKVRSTRSKLNALKETLPFFDSGNFAVVVVREPSVSVDDVATFEVCAPVLDGDWYADVETHTSDFERGARA